MNDYRHYFGCMIYCLLSLGTTTTVAAVGQENKASVFVMGTVSEGAVFIIRGGVSISWMTEL